MLERDEYGIVTSRFEAQSMECGGVMFRSVVVFGRCRYRTDVLVWRLVAVTAKPEAVDFGSHLSFNSSENQFFKIVFCVWVLFIYNKTSVCL